MKKSILLFLILTTAISCNKDQEPTEILKEFERTLPEAGNQVANKIIRVGNEVFIIGTNSNGNNSHILLLKTDLDGNVLWKRNIDVPNNTEGNDLICNSQNDLILVASVIDDSGDKNMLLIKTDGNGNPIWKKTFGGSANDAGRSVIELSSGGYMLLGTTGSFGAGVASMYVIRTDTDGNEIWSRTFGGFSLDGGSELVQANANEVLLLGFTQSFGAGDRDIYLQAVSLNGDSLWSSTYGGAAYEESQAIRKTTDGGYVLSSHSASQEPNHSLHALRLSENGSIIWEQHFGTPTQHEGGEGVLEDSEDNFVFVGYSSSNNNAEQAYLIKTDATGNLLSTQNFGGAGNQRITDLIETKLSYFIVGTSEQNNDADIFLLKVPK
ncbi:MAG: hypothetical protein JKX84_05975 [Flavobacteriales bacterium]|nr:hypothetical protein [Flavobacteriales bacterium]